MFSLAVRPGLPVDSAVTTDLFARSLHARSQPRLGNHVHTFGVRLGLMQEQLPATEPAIHDVGDGSARQESRCREPPPERPPATATWLGVRVRTNQVNGPTVTELKCKWVV